MFSRSFVYDTFLTASNHPYLAGVGYELYVYSLPVLSTSLTYLHPPFSRSSFPSNTRGRPGRVPCLFCGARTAEVDFHGVCSIIAT